jgi:hypothetical protein
LTVTASAKNPLKNCQKELIKKVFEGLAPTKELFIKLFLYSHFPSDMIPSACFEG